MNKASNHIQPNGVISDIMLEQAPKILNQRTTQLIQFYDFKIEHFKKFNNSLSKLYIIDCEKMINKLKNN